MIKTISAGGVVTNPHNEVLVVNQRGTSWSLPKGHVEAGEDYLQTAKREIKEESGLTKLHYMSSLGQYTRYKISKDGKTDSSERKTIIIFYFTTPQTTLKPLDPHNPEARWVKKEEVFKLLTHPKDKAFFNRIKNQI